MNRPIDGVDLDGLEWITAGKFAVGAGWEYLEQVGQNLRNAEIREKGRWAIMVEGIDFADVALAGVEEALPPFPGKAALIEVLKESIELKGDGSAHIELSYQNTKNGLVKAGAAKAFEKTVGGAVRLAKDSSHKIKNSEARLKTKEKAVAERKKGQPKKKLGNNLRKEQQVLAALKKESAEAAEFSGVARLVSDQVKAETEDKAVEISRKIPYGEMDLGVKVETKIKNVRPLVIDGVTVSYTVGEKVYKLQNDGLNKGKYVLQRKKFSYN